jgi:hypothetical protein
VELLIAVTVVRLLFEFVIKVDVNPRVAVDAELGIEEEIVFVVLWRVVLISLKVDWVWGVVADSVVIVVGGELVLFETRIVVVKIDVGLNVLVKILNVVSTESVEEESKVERVDVE